LIPNKFSLNADPDPARLRVLPCQKGNKKEYSSHLLPVSFFRSFKNYYCFFTSLLLSFIIHLALRLLVCYPTRGSPAALSLNTKNNFLFRLTRFLLTPPPLVIVLLLLFVPSAAVGGREGRARPLALLSARCSAVSQTLASRATRACTLREVCDCLLAFCPFFWTTCR
jgi:hypothetical protein